MKNKIIIFLIAMCLYCIKSEAQQYQISFLGDSGWIVGNPGSNPNNISTQNFKNQNLAGIGGDTVLARVIDFNGNIIHVDHWIYSFNKLISVSRIDTAVIFNNTDSCYTKTDSAFINGMKAGVSSNDDSAIIGYPVHQCKLNTSINNGSFFSYNVIGTYGDTLITDGYTLTVYYDLNIIGDTAIFVLENNKNVSTAASLNPYGLSANPINTYADVNRKFYIDSISIDTINYNFKSQGSKTLFLSDFLDFPIDLTPDSCGGGGESVLYDTILWYRNDTLIYSGTDTVFQANVSGDYCVRMKVCYKTICRPDTINTYYREHYRIKRSNHINVVINNIITSVSDLENNNFLIYPNPSSNNSTLFLSEFLNYNVFSEDGKCILKNQNGNNINISNFSNGIYFVVTKYGTNKIIINN